ALRERRAADYLKLWELTAMVPKWPRARLAVDDYRKLTASLMSWYFAGGGMYLSTAAQRAYKNVQTTITAVLEVPRNAEHDYDRVQKACSALRTALTADLLSRSSAFWSRPLF
ncbi:MAG TPA: hypothetical protein VN181_14615, partial [Thermoanaerobaculia bacterium]|nr:hypothetical protein [Thermoanaerobaculia bacterium]